MNLLKRGEQVISIELIDGQIEIVVRKPSNDLLLTNPPKTAPDKIWKLVYSATEDGKIELLQTIRGKHKPSHVVREKFIFD